MTAQTSCKLTLKRCEPLLESWLTETSSRHLSCCPTSWNVCEEGQHRAQGSTERQCRCFGVVCMLSPGSAVRVSVKSVRDRVRSGHFDCIYWVPSWNPRPQALIKSLPHILHAVDAPIHDALR